MPKAGLLHDYDLMANAEPTAEGNTCVVCDAHPVTYQWSDLHGEAMCCQCGCAYQLKGGSEQQEKEGKYPYCNLRGEHIPVLREYWNETKRFVHYGSSFSHSEGVADFNAWVLQRHPELSKSQS